MSALYFWVSLIGWPFAMLWSLGVLSGTAIEIDFYHWLAAFAIRLSIRIPTLDAVKQTWKGIKEEK